MKKFLLIPALLFAFAGGMKAQLTVHDFKSSSWEDSWDDTYSAMGEFHHVSANGQYAVGYDDQDQSAENGGAFLWKRSTPNEIEFVNTTSNRISLCDVANDGMVVGSFEERDPETDESTVCYPGYKTLDGTWTALPVPEGYSESFATDYSFMDEARAVSPDGKYIAGNAYIKVGEKDLTKFGFGVVDIVYLTPLVWEKTGDEYTLKSEFIGLGDEGKSYVYSDGAFVKCENAVNYKEFLVWDMSDDGTTIAGVNQSESGGQNPAIIRNGVLMQVFDCALDVNEEGDFQNFNGGICNSIDANGNVYGYFQEGDLTYKNFVLTADDKLTFFDSFVTCAAADGTTFDQSSNGVSYVLDCSDDGSVIVGAGVGYWEMGTYSYPMLASDDTAAGISRLDNILGTVSIDYRAGGNLYVNGLYNEAAIYNAAGAKVASGKQGHIFNMNTLPKGTYIVRVATTNGNKTFKVAK